jgi:iron complex transport system substrate-binding protein
LTLNISKKGETQMIRRLLIPPVRKLFLAGTVLFATALAVPPAVLAEKFTFTDQTGRKISVDAPVKRVVTIPIPAASMLIALDGGTKRLVGMHPRSKSAIEEGILRKFFPEALAIKSDIVGDGFMPNVEALVSVRPDIVFQWGHLGVDVVRPLENAGMNVALFMYGNQTDLEGWIRAFGDLIGRSDKADRMLDWHHTVLAEIERNVSGLKPKEKPRVLYFLRWLTSQQVAGEGTYNDYYINLTGGTNPAGDMPRFPNVSEEQIIVWDPEVILLNGFESALTTDDVYRNPKLQDVSAVRHRRVYKVPMGGYRWDPPNQESPLMWKWLSMVLHPDRFHWDLRSEIAAGYRWIYGQTPTENDIDEILRMPVNRRSDRYEALFGRR